MDWSLPGSSVHGILQARILEWVVVPFSRGSSNPGIEPRSPALQVDSSPSEPPGKPKNTGVGSLSLSPGCLHDPGIVPGSPALQVDSLSAELPGKPKGQVGWHQIPRPQGMTPPAASSYSFTRKVTSHLGKPGRWILFSILSFRVKV